MIDGMQMTCAVHPKYSDSIKSTMENIKNLPKEAQLETFNEHFITNIQGLINSLSKRRNCYPTAILNCCRVILPKGLYVMSGNQGLSEHGSLSIAFACELGGATKQGEE